MLFMSARSEPGAYTEKRQAPWPVIAWLLICCALVFAMVVLGGVTRLTGSGLSMVDWNPVKGIIPPLSQGDWERLFEQYRQFPEFRYVNQDMTLAGFKVIFLFEYAHRVLGRLIGLVFFVPLVWFWWRRRLSGAVKPHLVALFVLGGLQGLLGWFMVMSGLVDVPRVSQYRLTAHLCLAVAIYGYMLFVALELMRGDLASFMRRARYPSVFPPVLLIVVFVIIASGGFVAGTHAGHIYNTFPDMNGQLIPDGLFAENPRWLNVFENPVTIQFDHRMLAYLLVVLVTANRVILARAGLQSLLPAANLLLVLVLLQASIGIATLLHKVPPPLGAMHQAGALMVFSAAIWLFQRSRHVGA
ncbi:MAG: heme A synthase [Proteobacteria bacterium]|nr:MAG: heme A synthase [Pseudomonadota bacterium]